MQCFYINLDSATTRRSEIEENFARHKTDGWHLSRMAAVDANDIHRRGIAGSLSANHKACFMSHVQLLTEHAPSENPIMILEDDAKFGAATCDSIDRILDKIGLVYDWDIVFTDVCVPRPETMVALINRRQACKTKNETQILNLADMVFAGSTAYVVNAKSKQKILDGIDWNAGLNEPYDLFLRDLIYKKKLAGFCIFPFPTTLSDEADLSNINLPEAETQDLTWNTFRRMIWAEADWTQSVQNIERIKSSMPNPELGMFGTLISATLAR